MIGEPENDVVCLAHLHDFARTYSVHPVILRCAQAFTTPKEIALFLRRLPFRVDLGRPDDGPRVPCTPSQRLRVLPHDLNCYEGTGTFLMLAEALDPQTHRSSATIRLPAGYHTFPIEGNTPVNLDPYSPRNAIAAGYSQITGVFAAPQNPLSWFSQLAANAPVPWTTKTEVDDGWRQLSRAIRSGTPLDNPSNVHTFLEVASQQSHLWGTPGAYLAHLVRHKLAPLLSLDSSNAQETAQEDGQAPLHPFHIDPFHRHGSPATDVLTDSRPRADDRW